MDMNSAVQDFLTDENVAQLADIWRATSNGERHEFIRILGARIQDLFDEFRDMEAEEGESEGDSSQSN